jgi:nucleoside-diphosphate-sugar epimerase
MCFIIPTTMSVTGISSEDKPEWAETINVGGTKNVVDAIKSMPNRPKLIFSSSTQVFGHTQHENRPRCASDAVCVTDHYTDHKLRCEEMIKSSGLDWVILRFTAVLATKVGMNPDMFDVPLDMRMEFIHTKDVGVACANSVTCDEAVGQILIVGGGRSCQLSYREMVTRALDAFGVGMIPDKAFTKEPFAQDWADTAESQRMLKFQQRSYEDWLEDIKREAGYKRHLARMFRPVARWYLLRKSPYC